MIIGIDATRNRSGGARAHLVGLLGAFDPQNFGINEVHVWAYRSLLDSLPNKPWLKKHHSAYLEKSLIYQILWQIFMLPSEVRNFKCDMFLNTDAGALSAITPVVTMSRDMLSYESGEIERYGFSKASLRLYLLRLVQNRSLRRSDGVIFLTQYAGKIIQQSCGKLPNIEFIPHGVGTNFSSIEKNNYDINPEESIKLIYISNADLYKHQWKVIEAAEILRKNGRNISLTLVGGGSGKAYQMLLNQKNISDPHGEYIFLKEFVPQSELPNFLSTSDIFIFASSCENMPNTLVEAMAAGLPIACSDRGPMPEVLEEAGVYFNPESPLSISDAVTNLIENEKLRKSLGIKSKSLSKLYSWERCARETWLFLIKTFNEMELKRNE